MLIINNTIKLTFLSFKTPFGRLLSSSSSLLFAVVLICSNSLLAQAQQVGFSVSSDANQNYFSYQWRHQERSYNLEFSLDKQLLAQLPRSPDAYNERLFNDIIYGKVMRKVQQLDPKLGRVKVNKRNGGLRFSVESRSQKQAKRLLKTLQGFHKQSQSDYWAEHFFVKYASRMGDKGIRHDHAKYAKLSYSAFTPIIDAIKTLQQRPYDTREFIDIALSWVQSIPYDTLDNRRTSNGGGFLSPKDLLFTNKGDCDSKSTLFAALLKAYNPYLKVNMVYLRNHALLAIAMKPDKGDVSMSQNREQWILAEPTGPAQYQLGEVDEKTLYAIRNRQFDLKSL